MVALETTKRKFHKLLENITAPTPKAPHSRLHVPPEAPPSKRVRLETPAVVNETATSASVDATFTTLRAVGNSNASISRSKPVAKPASAAPPPNYVPWSHEYFLARLKTFANLHTWSSKPDDINEVAWAKRGWTCVGLNTVACKGGCEARVVVSLRPPRKDEEGKEIEGSEDYGVDVDDALVQRYVHLLVEGHNEGCLWRDNPGCDDQIYRLPIARKHVWEPQLKERYLSFARLGEDLPAKSTVDHPVNSLAELIRMLPEDFPNNEESSTTQETQSSETNHVAIAFALLGWYCVTEGPATSANAIATCNACFRRLGLWLYTNKSRAEEDLLKLDLFNSHRTYCPWVNADSQAMPGSFAGLAGWEILQRVIRNDASFRASSSSTSNPPVSSAPDISTLLNGTEHDEQARPMTGSTESSSSFMSSKEAKERVEKEDKARFARLKELTKAMGLGKSKGTKRKLDDS